MKYYATHISNNCIVEADVSCFKDVVYTTPEGFLCVNNELIDPNIGGYPKFYPNSSDLVTISFKTGLAVYDVENREIIFEYKDEFKNHIYDKSNTIFALTDENVCHIDLRKKSPIRYHKLRGAEEIKIIGDEIFLSNKDFIWKFDQKEENFSEIANCRNIFGFSILKGDVEYCFTKNGEKYFYKDSLIKQKEIDIIKNVNKEKCATVIKNIVQINEEEYKIQEVKEIKKIFFKDNDDCAFIGGDNSIFKIEFF